MAGLLPDETIDLSEWFKGTNGIPPYYFFLNNRDVVVIGLQEFVPLNIKTAMMGPNEERLLAWKKIIDNNLKKVFKTTKYSNFQSVVMMGLCIILYGSKKILTMISNIKSGKRKTGLHGMTENKGAVILSFNIGNTSICLMNCHLAHGKSSTDKRFEEIKTIHNSVLTEAKSEKIASDHDIRFFFGDLNFRIDLDKEKVCNLIAKDDIKEALKYDQLLTKGFMHELPLLNEHPIEFPPTYKFTKNTILYNMEKRAPAWCDRILWGTFDDVKCISYNYVPNIICTDHRPIYGIYSVNIKCNIESQEEEKSISQAIPDDETINKSSIPYL